MTALGWIVAGVVIWLGVAVVVGMAVGRCLRVDDEGPDPSDARRSGDRGIAWLVHHCPACAQDIEYVEPTQLPAVKRIHGGLCRRPTVYPGLRRSSG